MRVAYALLAMGFFLGIASPASSVVKPKQPLAGAFSKIDNVIVCKVSAVDEARRLVEADVTAVVKGKAAGQKVRIQIVEPKGLLNDVAPGQPVVIFVARQWRGFHQHCRHLGRFATVAECAHVVAHGAGSAP